MVFVGVIVDVGVGVDDIDKLGVCVGVGDGHNPLL
jgi:hypothetical protein